MTGRADVVLGGSCQVTSTTFGAKRLFHNFSDSSGRNPINQNMRLCTPQPVPWSLYIHTFVWMMEDALLSRCSAHNNINSGERVHCALLSSLPHMLTRW